MAYLAQRLARKAGWLAAAALLMFSPVVPAGPFSHQIHLQLKLPCATCHPAASSTQVADNNLPKPDVCAGCHKDGARPVKAPRLTNLSRFSHKQHLQMGNLAPAIAKAIDAKEYLSDPGDIRRHLDTKNACTACHRGLEESSAVSAAVFPQMADCLVCHNKIDPPFSCETCHERTAALKPATHTQDYLDRHTKTNVFKDKTTCAVCHGRRFTCLGCH